MAPFLFLYWFLSRGYPSGLQPKLSSLISTFCVGDLMCPKVSIVTVMQLTPRFVSSVPYLFPDFCAHISNRWWCALPGLQAPQHIQSHFPHSILLLLLASLEKHSAVQRARTLGHTPRLESWFYTSWSNFLGFVFACSMNATNAFSVISTY